MGPRGSRDTIRVGTASFVSGNPRTWEERGGINLSNSEGQSLVERGCDQKISGGKAREAFLAIVATNSLARGEHVRRDSVRGKGGRFGPVIRIFPSVRAMLRREFATGTANTTKMSGSWATHQDDFSGFIS